MAHQQCPVASTMIVDDKNNVLHEIHLKEMISVYVCYVIAICVSIYLPILLGNTLIPISLQLVTSQQNYPHDSVCKAR